MKKRCYIIFFIILNVSCQESKYEQEQKREQDSLQVVHYIDSILIGENRSYSQKVINEGSKSRTQLYDSIFKGQSYPNQNRDSTILETRLANQMLRPEVRFAPMRQIHNGDTINWIKLKKFDYPGGIVALEKFINDTINRTLKVPSNCLNGANRKYIISYKAGGRIQDLKIISIDSVKKYKPLEAEISRIFHIMPKWRGMAFAQENKISEQVAREQKDYIHIKLELTIDTNMNVRVKGIEREKDVFDILKERGYNEFIKKANGSYKYDFEYKGQQKNLLLPAERDDAGLKKK